MKIKDLDFLKVFKISQENGRILDKYVGVSDCEDGKKEFFYSNQKIALITKRQLDELKLENPKLYEINHLTAVLNSFNPENDFILNNELFRSGKSDLSINVMNEDVDLASSKKVFTEAVFTKKATLTGLKDLVNLIPFASKDNDAFSSIIVKDTYYGATNKIAYCMSYNDNNLEDTLYLTPAVLKIFNFLKVDTIEVEYNQDLIKTHLGGIDIYIPMMDYSIPDILEEKYKSSFFNAEKLVVFEKKAMLDALKRLSLSCLDSNLKLISMKCINKQLELDLVGSSFGKDILENVSYDSELEGEKFGFQIPHLIETLAVLEDESIKMYADIFKTTGTCRFYNGSNEKDKVVFRALYNKKHLE